MDGADVAVLVQAGERLFAFKLFLTSTHCLWMYDYLLTLGDEIQYAWSGKKTWIFVLFIANRYTPVLYLIWINVVMFNYTKSLCQETKWIAVFHTAAVSVLAQVAFALRIYAVTGRNKLLGGSLLVLISAQFCFGICFIIRTGMSPPQSLPEINLDAFKLCFYKRWQLGELLFTNLVIAFDLLAFLTILVTAKRPGANRYPGIPRILDTILRDATLYFVFIFACQVMLEFFLLFAPEEIQLMPGVVNTIFVPIMASRLMLSVKKAAVGPAVTWSLTTMTDFGRGITPGTVHFASPTLNGSHEIPEAPALPNEGDIELESIPRLAQNRGP